MRHKLSKQDQIRGLRKALANPKLPKQFRPSMKKRLAKLLGLFLLVCFFPSRSRAQFLGYTSPQSVQQTLAAAGTACTGSAQNFIVTNLGQTQHYASIVPSAAITSLMMVIQGTDAAGNIVTISDAAFVGTFPSGIFNPVVTATGYWPKVTVSVTCTGGTFTLAYSGSSASPNVNAGGFLIATSDKVLLHNWPTQTSKLSPSFVPPYGSAAGKLVFAYDTGIAGSTLVYTCTSSNANTIATYTFTLGNIVTNQVFPIADVPCAQITINYVSGGATNGALKLDYVFDPPGRNSAVTNAQTLVSAFNLDSALTEKGPRWVRFSSPAGGSLATAAQPAAAGVQHVADCVSFSAAAGVAPALTNLFVSLRDGASGAGAVLWQVTVEIPAATGQSVAPFSFCGLNLIGSVNTAMTLEFSAALANLAENVSLTGYDVQ